MISINATLLLQIVHFLILVFILKRLLFRPILKVVDEREQHFESTKNQIHNIEQEAVRLRDEFHKREIGARKDAAKERVELRSNGLAQVEELYTEARNQVLSIRAEADQEAQTEIKKTKPFLRDEATILVDEIVEWVIGRRIENTK